MTTLVTGTPGSGKTTLVEYAKQHNDTRFYDADELPGLCEWREFKTGKVMGLVTDFVETGEDEWYTKYGWYWREGVLREFLASNPDAIVCGSSENVVGSYGLFDKVVILKVAEDQLLSNLSQPTRNNPFGKTPKQRANFMNWQDYLISGAASSDPIIIEGNQTLRAYEIITHVLI